MLETPEARPEITCRAAGPCGVVTLDRPQALNALTHGMVREIAAALDAWEHDDAISRVVVRSAGGKAFCAGGDIRWLHELGQGREHAAALAFWRDEYRLNLRIKRYPKPYVALVDGIVMGGGAGLAIHAAHMVAGDRFSFAMPEVGIGFFPDVGASYFLPRLPGHAGTRLALTGARVGAPEALALGLASAHAPGGQFASISGKIIEGGDIDAILAPFRRKVNQQAVEPLESCFAGTGIADILARLDAEGSDSARKAAKAIRQKSPTSLAIALRQMQLGASLTMEEALEMEFTIVSRLSRGKDFHEGVRALVIDKDNAPAWLPARIEDVLACDIDIYFAPLPGGGL